MISRRDFIGGGLLSSAALGWVSVSFGAEGDRIQKIPLKGAMFQRRNGQLVLMGRGIVASVSDDQGRTWSDPKPLMQGSAPVRSTGNVLGLLRLQSGRIALCYGRTSDGASETDELLEGPSSAKTEREEIFFRTSGDEGATWSDEISVTPMPGDELYAFHGSMVQLASGRIILPAYTNFSHNYVGRPRGVGHGWLPEYCATHMLYSDDEGKTWDHTGGLFMWKDMGQGGHVDCNEACVADTADGRVLMLARNSNMRVLRSYSRDGGKSWSLVEFSDLSTSDAPVRLKRIPSTGDLLIVWNQVTTDEHRNGYGRSRLSTAISKDSGNTWQHFKNLEVSPGMSRAAKIYDPQPPQFARSGQYTKPDQIPNNSIRGMYRYSYSNVHFFNDQVYIDHDHFFRPNVWATKEQRREVYQKLHILPLDWLYS